MFASSLHEWPLQANRDPLVVGILATLSQHGPHKTRFVGALKCRSTCGVRRGGRARPLTATLSVGVRDCGSAGTLSCENSKTTRGDVAPASLRTQAHIADTPLVSHSMGPPIFLKDLRKLQLLLHASPPQPLGPRGIQREGNPKINELVFLSVFEPIHPG